MSVIAFVETFTHRLDPLVDMLRIQGYKTLQTSETVPYVSLVVLEEHTHNIPYQCVAWRSRTENPQLPILIATAHTVAAMRERAFDWGADGCVSYSHETHACIQKIKSYIGQPPVSNTVSCAADAVIEEVIEKAIQRTSLLPWPQLLKRIGGRKTVAVVKAPSPVLNAVAHSHTEKQALAYLNGTHALDTIIGWTQLSSVRLYAMLETLLELGYAHISVHDLHGARNHVEFELDVWRYKAHTQHYFLFLGVTPSDTYEKIAHTYQHLKGSFSALRNNQTWSSEYAQALDEILSTLDDAWYVLSNDERRALYTQQWTQRALEEQFHGDAKPASVLKLSKT
jgi:hypothetical protein